jgi:hypothetical protein
LPQSYPDLSLRLAISIDDVTGVGTTALRLSNPGNTRQSAPLWTVALAQQVLAHHGLEEVPTGSRWGMDNPVLLLYSFLQQRGLGSPRHTSTDVFLDRGDAVIGIAAYSPHAVADNNSLDFRAVLRRWSRQLSAWRDVLSNAMCAAWS